MSEIKRQSLNINLDELFPGETVEIGTVSILIRPLSFLQVAVLSKKIKGLSTLLIQEGVSWENYTSPDSIFKIAVIVIDNFPEILEEASNVDINDLRALPIELVAKLLDVIIAVNMKSKEALEKNLTRLAERLVPKTEPKAPKKIKKNK